MPLQILCPQCGKVGRVADEHARCKVKCSACGTMITVLDVAPVAEILQSPEVTGPPPVPQRPPESDAPPPLPAFAVPHRLRPKKYIVAVSGGAVAVLAIFVSFTSDADRVAKKAVRDYLRTHLNDPDFEEMRWFMSENPVTSQKGLAASQNWRQKSTDSTTTRHGRVSRTTRRGTELLIDGSAADAGTARPRVYFISLQFRENTPQGGKLKRFATFEVDSKLGTCSVVPPASHFTSDDGLPWPNSGPFAY